MAAGSTPAPLAPVEEPWPVAACPWMVLSAVPEPVLDEIAPDWALEMATPVAVTPPAETDPVPKPAPDAAPGFTTAMVING